MVPHSPKIVRKIRRDDTEISRCIKYENISLSSLSSFVFVQLDI